MHPEMLEDSWIFSKKFTAQSTRKNYFAKMFDSEYLEPIFECMKRVAEERIK